MSKDNLPLPPFYPQPPSYQYYPHPEQFNHLHSSFFMNPYTKPLQNFPSHPQEQFTIYQQPRYLQPYEYPSIIQRVSSIVKYELPLLQNVMIRNAKMTFNCKSETSEDRSSEEMRKGQQQEWLCKKCSFMNYEWRRSCKKCDWLKQQFTPGPEDWKCLMCRNINYARRNKCNRCKRKRSFEK